ncbi:SDR family NAD(P)-dependent oxidoreductase [Acuticoccus sp. M5D2P5]|uniref:SDR family NAD(P)-dependent oxidoreductase n=1 Tax=Acuticoccus kalidii TaxID=2910977 RepID=UPI001F2061B3|nr:SDR family NAD(P)-dependent oxidoreductase [Acuticoccus kalidii]MCF3934204.1 SDR family NAD(P)-dependent oxidoreductase [Acuticoccus kalidii]
MTIPPADASEDTTLADDPAKPALVIITGATGGIGLALAERLARPGLHIGLVGRDKDGLARAAAAVEARGGRAISSRIDITTPAFEHWLDTVSERFTLSALYANAGLSAGPASPRELESAADTERLVRTNLLGTINSVRAVAERMRAQSRAPAPMRRIGIVASVAGLLPTPDLAVYSATKAGLIAYAHGVRPRLKRNGISVTVLCPAFVTSPMSARHQGAKPFEISADKAAIKMVRAVEAGRRTAVFPLPFALLAYLAPFGPGWLVDALVPTFHAEIQPDPRVEPGFSQRLDRPRAESDETD